MKRINALILFAGLSMCIWGCGKAAKAVETTAESSATESSVTETIKVDTTTAAATKEETKADVKPETKQETKQETKESDETESKDLTEKTSSETQKETKPATYTADQYIKMVKTSKMTSSNSITYGESFEKYFSSPEWTAYKSEKNGQQIVVVEFNGKGKYNNADSDVRIQFSINLGAGRFYSEYFSVNGTGRTLDELNTYVNSIYHSTAN